MNANTRKCKTHKLVFSVHSAGTESVHGYRDMRIQKNICVYLRPFADKIELSEVMNEKFATITVDGRELKADG